MTSSSARAIISSAALFSALSFLPKFLAILKDMFVAGVFGASHALDVYLMAFVLIGVPVSVVAVAIQTTLIPALVNKDVEDAAALLGGAIKFALAMLAFALLVWFVLLPRAFEVLYPAESDGMRQQLLSACAWLIPYYFISGVNLLGYGALQARKIFWPNAVLPGLFPLAILLAVSIFQQADIRILLGGTVTGGAVEGLLLYFLLRKANLLRWGPVAKNGLSLIVRSAVPLMIGAFISALAPVVEQVIASKLGAGAVSWQSYGNKVPAALNSLLLTAVGIVVLPHFADLIVKKEWNTFSRLYSRLSGVCLLVGVTVTGIGIAFSPDVVSLLFERGAFTASDSNETSAIMRVYLMQLPFSLVAILSWRVLIAMGKTKILAWISVAQLMLGGGLAYVLSDYYDVVGIALGSTIAVILGAAMLLAMAWRQFREQPASIAT